MIEEVYIHPSGEPMYVSIPNQPIGLLHHTPTKTSIGVYEKIPWFKQKMLKIFFGLKYEVFKS